MEIFTAIARFFIPGLLVLVVALSFVFLFTKKNSRARNWLLATPNRIGWVGVGLLALIWTAIVIFNRTIGS
jgi:multisubunit Na+/H+ antiporter MnhB subunit